MRFFLTSKLSAFLILISLTAQAQSISVTRRGTDVGNGGDPVREIFNAARLYAALVMSRVSDDSALLNEQDLDPEVRKKILQAQAKIENHITNDLHHWGRFEFSECTGLDLSELDAIRLDYRRCAREYSNAAQATCELIRITLVKSTLLPLEEAKLATDMICENWAELYPAEWRTAGNIQLKHLGLVGTWHSDSPKAVAKVFPEGVIRLIKQFEGVKLTMVNFLTWQDDHGHFTTAGVLTCPLGSNPRYLNTVTEDTCRVPVQASVRPGLGERELDIELLVETARPQACHCPSPSNLSWRFYLRPKEADDL